MSHGPGLLQRVILEFMRRQAFHQRTPQREHWRIEQLVINILRRDPVTNRIRIMTSRQHADARKRIQRACASLVAAGLILSVGVGWTLPPETPEEARVRRKRLHISEHREQQQEQERQQFSSSVLDRLLDRPPIDRSTRRKLVKVLGQMSSDFDNVVLVAARQAERIRCDLGASWNELLVAS